MTDAHQSMTLREVHEAERAAEVTGVKLLRDFVRVIGVLAVIVASVVLATLLAGRSVAKSAPPMIPPLSAFSTTGNSPSFVWATAEVPCQHAGPGRGCWMYWVISQSGCPHGIYGEMGVGAQGAPPVDTATGKSPPALPARPVLDELTPSRDDGTDGGTTIPWFSCNP
jgi:hypothetical protein